MLTSSDFRHRLDEAGVGWQGCGRSAFTYNDGLRPDWIAHVMCGSVSLSIYDLTPGKAAEVLGMLQDCKSKTILCDEFGCIDWEANGWPEPCVEWSSVDTSMMPGCARTEWQRISEDLETAYENGW